MYGERLTDRLKTRLIPDTSKIFIFSAASRPPLEPIQSPIQWVPGVLSLGLKRSGRQADNFPPSTVVVKNGGAISPLPIRLYGTVFN
jgi:hypothetical protein